MRLILTVAALLLLWSPRSWCEAAWHEFDKDLAAIRALAPRPEGSENSRKLVDLLRDRLSQMRVAYSIQDFRDSEVMHSFASSVVATIPGGRPDTVLLCVPIDTAQQPEPGRDDSIGLALALETARQAASSRPPLTIQILFLGAEQGEGDAYPMSSRLFLEGYYPENPVLALYLNLDAVPERVVVRAGSEGLVAPLWLLRRTLGALGEAGLDARADGNEIQLVRAGLVKLRTPVGPFLRNGYPAVAIEGEYTGAAGNDREFAGAFAAFWSRFLEASRGGIPQSWDRHYLLFRIGSRHYFLSERDYLLLLLAVFAVSVVYIQLARRRLTEDIVITGEHLWLLPILFAATFAFLLAATGLVYAVEALRGVRDLWKASPGLFLALKVSGAAFLLIVASRLLLRHAGPWLERIPERFFPASALLVLIFGLMVVAAANVSLAVILLWPVFFVFLYEATRWTWLRLLCLVLAPASIAGVGLALILQPGSDAGRIVLTAPLRGNFVVAVLLLPYVLLLLDMTLSAPFSEAVTRAVRRAAPAVTAALSVALLAAALAFPPFGPLRPQVIDVTRYVDLTARSSRIEVTSSAPLGRIRYAESGSVKTVATRAKSRLLPAEAPGDLLTIRAASTPMLDRENVTVAIEPRGNPESIELAILSQEKFLLYDSSFPATRDQSGRAYTLHVGRYPPVPLEVELTLPQGQTFTLAVRLRYDDMPTSVELPGRNRVVRSRMIVDDGFRFRT